MHSFDKYDVVQNTFPREGKKQNLLIQAPA